MSLAPILTYLQLILAHRRQAASALEQHVRGHEAWRAELFNAHDRMKLRKAMLNEDIGNVLPGYPPGVKLLCDKCIDESDEWNAKAIAAVPTLPDYDRANWKAKLVGFQTQHRAFLEANIEAAYDWTNIPLDPIAEEPLWDGIREVEALVARVEPITATPIGANAGEGEALTGPERDQAIRSLESADRKAYLAYHYAETKKECRLEDREAYDLLHEEGIDANKGDLEDLTAYKLPSFDTWARQLRSARKALREQKHKRRGHRPTRSIVKGNQLENRTGDA